MDRIQIQPITVLVLEGMEEILNRSAGHQTSMTDEIEYFQSESPVGWWIAKNSFGENLGFIRCFRQGPDWSLAELYVEKNLANRKEIASGLLGKFSSETTFVSGHRLRFDLSTLDQDLNLLLQEAGFSQKKQTFLHFELNVNELNSDLRNDPIDDFSAKEVAETLSNLHPVSEAEASSWKENGSIRVALSKNHVVAAAQIYFYENSAEINRIATHPNHLRQGHAKKLFENIFREVSERKLPRIFLKVEDEKLAAIGFYRDFGFKEVPEKMQTWHSKYF